MLDRSNILHYLDNAATTMVSEKAAKKALDIMTQNYGNPSSLHDFGFMAQKELEDSRVRIAKALKVAKENVIFTSGATESNNTLIFSVAHEKKKLGNKIVVSSIEHKSVLTPIEKLGKEGFVIEYVNPNSDGVISEEAIKNAIDENTILVAIMSVNNETGDILPLESAAQAIKACGSKAHLHVDHVQGFGKIDFNIKKLNVNSLSLSGHKLHAPKGVGLLYTDTKITALIQGGGQEKNLRSGTENLPAITALAEAILEDKEKEKIKELKLYLMKELESFDNIKINTSSKSVDNIINFSIGEVRGETMLHFLAAKGIYVSTGSACTGTNGSHVLSAMGFDKKRILSSLRVSFSKYNNKEDIDAFISGLKDGLISLKK